MEEDIVDWINFPLGRDKEGALLNTAINFQYRKVRAIF